ncbi:C40 family peptidase [Streptomyces sp. PR69]|uniref:C40 family peptidase n=1 Tax=Streptomyces sp. PR69 TaxID=2984950 RepID=UPI002264C9EA|nr:NlpC/P60 family protein [Streptomyces sp. PR69]
MSVCGVRRSLSVLGALALSLAWAPPPPAAADPPESVAELLTELQSLYRQAEEATGTYRDTSVQLRTQQAETARLDRALAKARNAYAASRDEAGRLARAQYQGGSELSSYLRLLLARHPQSALDQGHLMDRAARNRMAAMKRLEAGADRAKTLAAAARKALDREQVLEAERKEAQEEAATRLKDVEERLAALSAEELTALAALEGERSGTESAQAELMASGVLDGERTPSEGGGEALRYAVDQIGKPYEWGAQGPHAYDCSGLTSQAWEAAGREIPRTSQEQWRTLPRVPLEALRPGDLVVYFPGATHVALYLGDGLVIQAPRPGTRVKVSPLAANPLLGAVRPDPGEPAREAFTRPELPADAMAGPDAGFNPA